MLILSRKIDEQIKIGDNITLTIIEVRGDQVTIQKENKAAAVGDTVSLDSLFKLLKQ